jgi:hypothetical protein
VLIPLLRDGRGRVRARFGVNVDIGCLRLAHLLIVRIIVLVLSALYASPHGPLTRQDVGLLTGTLSFAELFLGEIKAVVAQNRSVTTEVLLISIDRSAFRIVSYGVRKEPPAF